MYTLVKNSSALDAYVITDQTLQKTNYNDCEKASLVEHKIRRITPALTTGTIQRVTEKYTSC